MTFEKYEEAKEKYKEYDAMLQLAMFFSKDEFTHTQSMNIQKIEVFKDDQKQNVQSHYLTIFIPHDIREKINDLLWNEVHRIEDEFKSI